MEVVNHNQDAEGLQAVEQDNYPEVVPGQNFGGVARRNSMSSPEAYMTPDQHHDQRQSLLSNNDPKGAAYVGAPRADGDYFAGQQAVPQPSTSPGPPQYEYQQEKGLESQQKAKNGRICGLTRKVFFIVLAVVLLVVLGVALGVGLGIGLSSNSTSNSATSSGQYAARDKTGVAVLSMSDSSSSFYTYYIDASGMIVESTYENDAWTKNNTAPPLTTTNVTSLGAGANSPIAAVSYFLPGDPNVQYRGLFFFNAEGQILFTNTTGTEAWTQPWTPPLANNNLVIADTNAMSLAAVADSSATRLNGFRVYLGTSDKYVQEIGMDFDNGTWFKWASFLDIDSGAGVASVITGSVNHLYMRSSTGQLQLWTWDYTAEHNNPGTVDWAVAANSTSDNGVAEGGSIAAASDGITDYVFYQDVNGETVQTRYTGSGTSFVAPSANVTGIQSAPVGYMLSATYANGAVVMNQNSKSATELLFSSVSRNGQAEVYSTQTGASS